MHSPGKVRHHHRSSAVGEAPAPVAVVAGAAPPAQTARPTTDGSAKLTSDNLRQLEASPVEAAATGGRAAVDDGTAGFRNHVQPTKSTPQLPPPSRGESEKKKPTVKASQRPPSCVSSLTHTSIQRGAAEGADAKKAPSSAATASSSKIHELEARLQQERDEQKRLKEQLDGLAEMQKKLEEVLKLRAGNEDK